MEIKTKFDKGDKIYFTNCDSAGDKGVIVCLQTITRASNRYYERYKVRNLTDRSLYIYGENMLTRDKRKAIEYIQKKKKHLLEEGDFVVCTSAEREFILKIARNIDITLYKNLSEDCPNYPNLIFSHDYVDGLKKMINDNSSHYTELSPTQFIAKIFGVDVNRVKKIKELKE